MSGTPFTREQMAARIARDLPDGATVNLGIGMPTGVADHIPAGREILFHSENGVLGIGPAPAAGGEIPGLINAGSQPVTLLPGGSYFHQADSFSMARGGHLDIAVLGGFQVAANGDLANWKVAGKRYGNVGGAMDIVVGAKQVFVMMTHATREGEPKIVERLTYPATALACVTRIYTDLAVIDVTREGLVLVETAPGFEAADVQKLTGAPLRVPPR